MIKQNVVFVENKAGSLKRVTGILADNGINIYGFACFDAPEFAIFRMICNDPDKAEIVLNRSGYMNRITQAIVVDMKDQVGGLDELLKVASDSNVSLDYIYTSFHRKDLRPVVILQTEDGAVTECILKNNGFNVFNFSRRTGEIILYKTVRESQDWGWFCDFLYIHIGKLNTS